ncbi:MAG: DNA polymerase III subunit alpha [Legionella sp.]|nr:DNA polymerase III subunit alpha [Legionella sp.]
MKNNHLIADPSKNLKYVHLNVHTEYSLIDGLVRINPLMEIVKHQGMQAVAITDYCNLFAAVKVFKAATKRGIKPILGADLPCYDAAYPNRISSLVLLCQNEQGYRNLTCLISRAYQEGQIQGLPRVNVDWIPSCTDGLIALSGGRLGAIGQALLSQDKETALALIKVFMQHFPQRFYLEIQRTGQPEEADYNDQILALAKECNLPLVATNAVRFLKPTDFEAHEARVCIHDGLTLADPKRSRRYTPAQHLRSPQEMIDLFQDLPQALANTVEIAKRCTVRLDLGSTYLPNFPIPPSTTIEGYLSQVSRQGLEEKLHLLFDNLPHEQFILKRTAYDERLKLELDVINAMGFAGYFLIVADFIQWAKHQQIPVGPGRGSGAGSLVAYVLKITDLDPLQYDLLFERFLNPERVSMPDFDIDFCMEGRDRVIDYVTEKYGRQSVSQIITFGSMAAKAVVRDVGRVLAFPYGFVDTIAKLIPFEIGMTLTKALDDVQELRRRYEEEDVKTLIDLALKLEGITRNAGKHAGGLVIAPSKLTDFTAIYCEEGSSHIVSQFDKDDVEAVGLVKFDFLGLRTLTIIDWTITNINKQNNQSNPNQTPIDIAHIPTDDSLTFDLLKACQTTAVFQLESRGMKELIYRLQPDCFEDIIALVALFRPGPLQSGMVDDFVNRKHGIAQVAYPHPDLEPILKPTYGVILYQEQVMQIAQVLANYTLGAADLLRRAMGKKKPEEMAKQRTIFTEGAIARGVEAKTATHIFDLMEKFAGYGFNKSHSAAYALIAYQTAWLKAHYPAFFMASVVSSDMDNTDKVVGFLQECAQMQLKVLPPDINQSHYVFTVFDDHTLVYGLGAIKGVGESAIQCIVESRKEHGPFSDLFDFCERLDLRKVNRRALEALIKSGAMDGWKVAREILQASLEKALKLANKTQETERQGQTTLFDLLSFEKEHDHKQYEQSEPWSEKERLKGEKETLGFYLTGHPAADYCNEFALFVTKMGQLNPRLSNHATVCGLILSVRRIMTQRRKILSIVQLEDPSGKIDIIIFSEVTLQSGEFLVVEGDVSADEYSGGLKMTANRWCSIETARSRFGAFLQLSLSSQDKDKLAALQTALATYPGDCVVRMTYNGMQARALLEAGKQWHIAPSDDLLQDLRQLLGENRVNYCYPEMT